MNRADFQRLAGLRVEEAKILLDQGYYSGAYYLAGYAVECALKACIARQTKRHDFPPAPDVVRNMYVHDLARLLKQAQLEAAHKSQRDANPQFRDNWDVVKDWSERSRYDYDISERRARDLYAAVTDRRNGVLSWLKKYW
jgi:HEPN domain-containing protein